MKKISLHRTEEKKIIQFRANMYKHVKHASLKACWQCQHSFKNGESVNVCITDNGNEAICTDCAGELGLLDIVDERGFVNLDNAK